MKVRWHVSGGSSPRLAAELRLFGIETDLPGLFSFDILETDPAWQPLRALLAEEQGVIYLPTTIYDGFELEAARQLYVSSTWLAGYPQPENSFPSERTFDLSDYCAECGVGARQIAPYLSKREPRWGKRAFMGFYWVYSGALFARPDVWEKRLRPLGIGSSPVLNTSGRELRDVVQLLVEEEVSVDKSHLSGVVCKKCGRTRYVWPTDRYAPASDPARSNLAISEEWFGPGGSAANCVLVASPAFYAAVRDLAAIRFEPAP